MSEVFIPLGGAGGKNRGEGVQVDEDYTYLKLGNSGVGIPLPAGNYKALKAVHGEETPFSSYGDGKNAAVFMTKEFLKKVTIDYFEIASITNFKLTMYAHRQVRLTWKNPSMGLWSGVHFVFKYDSMPTNENDGFMVYDSADVHYETAKLEERELFVRAYSYVTVKDGRWYDDGAVSARITVSGISGSVTLSTGAGVWTVPDNVYKIRYIVVGQGGKGDDNSNLPWRAGAGGGGGYFATGYMDVTPHQQIAYTIPSIIRWYQGISADEQDRLNRYYRHEHINKIDTVFGGIRAQHGQIGWGVTQPSDWTELHGGNGGSGGGGGNGGVGGVNGSDGGTGGTYPYGWHKKPVEGRAGIGSHQSTTGFNGVLYCSGGTGGTVHSFVNGVKGTDGLGNGGGGAGTHTSGIRTFNGGEGGTGCIYIAWGSLMNDGS